MDNNKREDNIRTAALLLFFLIIVVLNQGGVQRYLKNSFAFFGAERNENKISLFKENDKSEGGVGEEKFEAAKLAEKSIEENKAKDYNINNNKNVDEEVKNKIAPVDKSNSLPLINIEAEAALIIEKRGGSILYRKNINKKLPMASLTKLMTALIVAEYGNFGDEFAVAKSIIRNQGDGGRLIPGKRFKIGGLVKMMLIESSNDAAVVLREYFRSEEMDLVGLMNEKAKELGLINTRFANSSGLDSEDHFSSALDLAALLNYISVSRPEVLAITANEELKIEDLDKGEYILRNTNILLGKFFKSDSSDVVIKGGKTGYTDNAKECLIIYAEIKGKDYIFVILGSNDRFGEMEKMIEWVRDNV